MHKRIYISALSVLVIIASLISCLIYDNSALTVSRISIESEKLPSEFEGFCIAHISDLHNEKFGKDGKGLASLLRELSPDITVITGDLIDSRRTDVQAALDFIKDIADLAPVYYVTGNHEERCAEYQELKKGLISYGVTVLENGSRFIERDGSVICIAGINDPTHERTDYLDNPESAVIANEISSLSLDNSIFTVLLSHRPEFFDIYVSKNIDLTLSGHAHGGQVRLPFIGGLVAPNQGLFPKYDSGLYKKDGCNMVVSRGLGNSIIPLRVSNCPEVVLIQLEK